MESMPLDVELNLDVDVEYTRTASSQQYFDRRSECWFPAEGGAVEINAVKIVVAGKVVNIMELLSNDDVKGIEKRIAEMEVA